MQTICKTSGSVAYVQGDLDHESWEIQKDGASYSAVHRKWMTRISGLGQTQYLKDTRPVTQAQARAFANMSDEMRVIEMRKLFGGKRNVDG